VKESQSELAATCGRNRHTVLGQDLIEQLIHKAHVLPSQGVSMFLDRRSESVKFHVQLLVIVVHDPARAPRGVISLRSGRVETGE